MSRRPTIDPAAAQGFARPARAYERGRPGYPPEAIALLASRLPSGAEMLDLAAGTGALSRPLLEAGFEVTAVEPVAEMRAALPATARVNVRLLDHPVHAAIDDLIGPHRGDTPRHRSGAWRAAFDRTRLFDAGEEHVLPNSQELDAEGLAARVGSTSFVAALDPPARERVLGRARALAGDGTVTLPYRTEVLIWRRT
jgi:SAM-dependent methyltransferase